MDAGAGAGGVEDDAGEGVDVVGEAGALVGGGWGQVWGVWGGLCFAGGEDAEAERGELEADAGGEGEGEVFLEQWLAGTGGEMGAGVVAAVGGVEEDEAVIEGGPWRGGGLR